MLEAQGRDKEAQQARWEMALFLLHQRQLDAEQANGGRFGPLVEYNDGT
jgi:hypothetical protein